MTPLVALALCRFLHDTATMLVWGASAYLATLVPRVAASHVGTRIRPVLAASIAIAAVGTLAVLPIEAAVIGDGWSDAIDVATVQAVLFETSVGRAWQAQAAAAVLLVATCACPSSARTGARAAASGLLLVTRALTGHAAMHEGWLGIAHRFNHAIHILAAGAWMGALVPLLPLLRALNDPVTRHDSGLALRRFSVAGHGAVALAVASGVTNVWLVLGRWPTGWASPYQALLLTKVALVAGMVALALANRYRTVPEMKVDPTQATRVLHRRTVAALCLGAAVVGCVSVFGLLEPA